MSQVLIDMGALKMVLNVLRRAGKAEVADELEKAVGELPAPSTPSAKWYAQGEPDPHGDRYNGERAALMLGHLTDDELANAVFLHYDIRPPLQDIIDGKAHSPIAYVTAAKERIRWLSRALERAIADSKRLAGLRELMGYVEDGSSDTVKLFQDDTTKSFFVKVGRREYFSDSFKGAIDEAIAEDLATG